MFVYATVESLADLILLRWNQLPGNPIYFVRLRSVLSESAVVLLEVCLFVFSRVAEKERTCFPPRSLLAATSRASTGKKRQKKHSRR